MTLLSVFGRYNRKLRRYCKMQLRQTSGSASAVWVADNFRLLSSSLLTAKGYASRHGKKALLPLFFMCKKFFSHSFTVSKERIIAFFSSENPDISECEALSVMLFAGAAAVVCDSIPDGDGELVISLIKNLQLLQEIDFDEIINNISRTEKYLLEDPAGIYEKMNTSSKKLYRRAVKRGARGECISEKEYAGRILNAAREENRHIGFFLPLISSSKVKAVVFIAAEWIIAASLSIFAALIWDLPYLIFAFIFPFYAVIKPFSDRLYARIFPTFSMLSLKESEDIDKGVIITVSSFLPDAGKTDKLYEHLSRLRSSVSLRNVKVLLLADKKNAPSPELDSDKAETESAVMLIDRLNKDFGGGFLLAVRDRVYSSTENEYTGFERKRGAIAALTKYLKMGDVNGFSLVHGDKQGLPEMKYILALDSDTVLSFETVRRLLAAAEHPLNTPVYSPGEKRIVSGYGIIVPRIETTLASAAASLFSGIFTNGGSLSYVPRVNERYSDMFGESIFSGKGLINIDAFNRCCADKFDEGRILSHDILEGSVMRTGFLSVSEFSDSFPATAAGYYARLHRWIRGDVQNLKYIFAPLGKSGDSPCMPTLGRYQLFDNFRRALTPVISFFLLAFVLFFPLSGRRLLFFVAVLSVIAEFIPDILFSLTRFAGMNFTSLYISKGIADINKAFMKAVLALGALPVEVYFRSDAVIKAFYRSLISKKNLLQWKTASAADSEKTRSIFTFVSMPVMWAFLMFIYGDGLFRLIGIFILIFTVFCRLKNNPFRENVKQRFSESEKKAIMSYARDSWKFFSENVTSADNWLPPDNIQEVPVFRKAMRTSPTNIGLYLVSILAAFDMKFITEGEMLERISNTLDTIERLPKFRGLLYNWYDTPGAVPMAPFYVSSVDCGNYLVCLTALKQGLYEYGFSDTAERIEKLIEESDLAFLYDKKRELFRIGYDCFSEKFSSSFYDLYMSEARMTSYFACAGGLVPAAHWESLDRTLKRSSCYVTAASWTGTMFEYFMPSLFLPHPPGSFAREGLKVALYTQKKYAARKGIPYGISESCFYSIDSMLNYRYKAHGIRKLALKRDADEEKVVSPYSVFLTLPFDKKSALKNLKLLEKYGTVGRYGFYEAVDFSEKHLDGEEFGVVRAFMSHHIGMSIISMANVLCDDAFVKRFTADRKMASAASLLEEKLPVHPDILLSLKEKTERIFFREKNSFSSRSAPEEGSEVFAYTNGEITLMCDRYGRNRSLYAFSELMKFSPRSQGVSIAVNENGKNTVLFPDKDGNIRLKKYCAFSEKNGDGSVFSSALLVHPSENALLFPVKIRNNKQEAGKFTVNWYLEPLLLRVFGKDMHPAFSDMFVKLCFDENARVAVFRRSSDENFPCIAIGLYSRSSVNFNGDRENLLKINPDRADVFDDGYFCSHNPVRGISPVLGVSTELSVKNGKNEEAVLIAAVGSNQEDAVSTLENVRKKPLPAVTKGAAATFFREKITFSAAGNFLSETFFAGEKGEIGKTAVSALKTGREALWELGISGDIPVITVFPDKDCPEAVRRAYITLYKRLRKSSVPADLVFVFENSADYDFSGDRELMSLLEAEGLSDMLCVKGGIHILYKPLMKTENFTALISFSALIYPENGRKNHILYIKSTEILSPSVADSDENGFRGGGYLINHHPPVPWCHTLSNKTFGTLLTDRSAGYSWCYNSRQNKLTPWSNDTASGLYGERIFIKTDGRIYDAVKNSSVYFTPEKAQYACTLENMKAVVTIEIPLKGNRKRISVEISDFSGKQRECEIIYCISPVLGEGGEESFIRITAQNDCVLAENPLNTDFYGIMYVSGEGEEYSYYDSFYAGKTENEKGLSAVKNAVIPPYGCEKAKFELCFAPDKNTAVRLLQSPFIHKNEYRQSFDTGYPFFDRFASTLLYHQVRDTRLQARCGFYQCSGAIGFRDQLQDAMALINRDNRTVKQMIFRCASAQFSEGDVLHWFHPVYRKGLIYKGVRTKISDDLLWLPLAVARYVRKTGDTGILSRKIPYLEGIALKDGVKDEYREFRHSDRTEALYIHCLRALNKANTSGAHSLPLMGTGDWNDSFDKVGENGTGESVWLGMFLKKVCEDFSGVCFIMNDSENGEKLLKTAERLAFAVDKNAWNGKWYVRAFYDDGTVLGDENATACEIDLLCQSWSSLADMPDKDRVKTALLSAYTRLFDEESGVVKLFSPPFSEKSRETGYVNRYPEGMRENGGQYTHAAVWFCMALFKEGLTAQAEKVLTALIPSEKYKKGMAEVYKTEPYALAGDVYSAPHHEGRGGWSLYTGSAGWLLQLADKLSEDRKNQKNL